MIITETALKNKMEGMQGMSSYLVASIPYVVTVLGLVIYAVATIRRVRKTRRAQNAMTAPAGEEK